MSIQPKEEQRLPLSFVERVEADRRAFQLERMAKKPEPFLFPPTYNAVDDALHEPLSVPVPQLVDEYGRHMDEHERRRLHQDVWNNLIQWDRERSGHDPQAYTHLILRQLQFERHYPSMEVADILRRRDDLYAVDAHGNRIYLVKSLGIDVDQRVLLGHVVSDTKLPARVVVKWTPEPEPGKDVAEEIEHWKRVQSVGVRTPWLSFDFVFWGEPVLAIEFLQPLGPEDDEFTLGAVLLPDLAKLHTVGVHCDIKPDNIMKRGAHEYFLIDYGGLATTRKYYGFKRFTWSPKWTSQVYEWDQVCTGKNDLLELGYTMRALQLGRELIRSPQLARQADALNPRLGFFWKLRAYMERVRQIDERTIRSDDYTQLARVLTSTESFSMY